MTTLRKQRPPPLLVSGTVARTSVLLPQPKEGGLAKMEPERFQAGVQALLDLAMKHGDAILQGNTGTQNEQ
jgi:hypothetical protein